MAWSISDLFPPWGDTGERPSDNFQYDGGDQVNEKHFDYLWNQVGALENETRSALSDLDGDGDGIVDEADTANLYKGNDIDSDGDGTVDQADYAVDADASTYKGNDIDSDGDGTVDEANSTLSYKGNDIDSDGDGTVDEADSALTYKGVDIDSDGDGTVNNSDQLEGNTTSTVRNHAPNAHAGSHKDGGTDELDAAELAGGLGAGGQVLTTDGAAASWSTAPGRDPLFGDGSDGSITDSSNVTRSGIYSATDYTLQSGNTLTVDQTDGFIAIFAQNSITIDGTINGSGQGALGGAGGTSEGSGGSSGNNAALIPFGSGGAGGSTTGGGGGGSGGDGDLDPYPHATQAQGGVAPLLDAIGEIGVVGGGGGGGGAGDTGGSLDNTNGGNGSSPGGGGACGGEESGTDDGWSEGGDGGNGGAGVILVAPQISVSGTIDTSGNNGQDAPSASSAGGGGGGGGSGGVIFIAASDLIESTPSYNVSAGAGGSGENATANGGDGASGQNGELIKLTT